MRSSRKLITFGCSEQQQHVARDNEQDLPLTSFP